ncbi:single-stranded DNA-binding protein [Candidatus Sumerlaeota bacterium]|nr:single-stranded DNA-binding protein [Candidatus Sumerlaeota bacterium]
MLEINKVFLLGNLTRDPEVRYLPSGTMVTAFDLAVNRSYKDRSGETKQETLFIRVESWGKTAEFVSEYLKKGRRVFVEGRLRSDSWETRDGQRRSRIMVHAERVHFADLKPPAEAEEVEPEQKVGVEKEEPIPQDEVPPIDVNDEDVKKTENNLPF